MSTRYLTCVVLNGEYKVAQYGQMDGHPKSAGIQILNFLKTVDVEVFRGHISKLRFRTEEESAQTDNEIDAYLNSQPETDRALFRKENEERLWNPSPELSEKYLSRPFIHLHRDLGCKILDFIMRGNTPPLNNDIDFAGCSLHCAWVYVIDLDRNQLEVFRGFNKEPLSDNERFYGVDGYKEFEPVKHLATFTFDQLPSVEDFLERCPESN
jgi:hypothetical protein